MHLFYTSGVKTCSCGTEFEPYQIPGRTIKSKYCIRCLVEKGRKKLKSDAKKVAEAEKRKWNKEKKKIKQGLKSLTDYEKDAKAAAQLYARLRDKDQPCISCGGLTSPIWDGGHRFKAEIYSGVIFDEHNIHKQCRKCNFYLGGNEDNYHSGLIKRYGTEYVEALEKRALETRNRKYTREELIGIKNYYKNKIKQLNQTL